MASISLESQFDSAEQELERSRLRIYLTADGGPPALVEVETAARAEEISKLVARQCEGKTISEFRPQQADAAEQLPQWVEKHPPDSDVLLIVLAALSHDETLPPEFWKGANYNRERLWPGDAKTLFVLTPSQVRSLACYARDLWDWIPLKFDLRNYDEAAGSATARQEMADSRSGATDGSDAQRLPGLRERLLQVRQDGLPDAVIRRDFAWPLFRTLVEAGFFREAGNVLNTDLSGDFVAELATTARADWYRSLGYFYLGRHDLDNAQRAFVAISDLNEEDSADTCFGLGRVAQARRDLEAAKTWYQQAREIKERLGDEHGAASTYHQLGLVAQTQRDIEAAETWYQKSREIKERLGDEHGAAITYHQLGRVAEERRDLEAAETWYQRSREIEERLGNEHGTAISYHQLGMVAEERRDLEAAEAWFRRSLEIKERLGNEHGAAITDMAIAILKNKQGDTVEAGRWMARAVTVFSRTHDEWSQDRSREDFASLLTNATPEEHTQLVKIWQDADIGPLPADGVE